MHISLGHGERAVTSPVFGTKPGKNWGMEPAMVCALYPGPSLQILLIDAYKDIG